MVELDPFTPMASVELLTHGSYGREAMKEVWKGHQGKGHQSPDPDCVMVT